MQPRTLCAGVLALALVGAVAACGGGGGGKTSAPATTASAPPTTAAETTTTTASRGGSFADAKNCADLASLAAKVERSVQPTGNGTVDMNRQADALHALADAAPDAIKGDFKTFADAFSSFAKTYADAGFKPGKTPTPAQIAKLTAASQKLSTPKVQAAMNHLEAWGRTHCSGLTGTNP